MSTYGIMQGFSGVADAIFRIVILIFASPFLVALFIGGIISLWNHSFSPLLIGLFFALLFDIAIIVLAFVILAILSVQDKIRKNKTV